MMRKPTYLWAHVATAVSLAVGALSLSNPSDDVINKVIYPKSLSEFGFFDGSGLNPSKALISYDLKSPLFSDYSEKSRYIYIPDGEKATAQGNGLIDFPEGSAIIKNFGYMQDGKMHLIETRLLLRREAEWLALPYVWNDSQDDALLKLAGKRLSVDFHDPSGKPRTIDYAVPNKNQCKECHGVDNGIANSVMPIGIKVRNLSSLSIRRLINKDKLALNKVYDQPVKNNIEEQAKAYLDINCAHCHNSKGSASNSGLFLDYEQSDPVAYGIYKRPVAAGRGSGGLEFAISPQKPEESIIIHRMKSNEAGVAMPQIGRSIRDDRGIALISAWIESLPQEKND